MTETNVKIRLDESNAGYHKLDGHDSHTMIETFYDSPQRYAGQYITGEIEREETAAMRRGSLVHALVLEPERFEEQYYIIECTDRRTKIWKECSEVAVATGRIPITVGDWEDADVIADSVLHHPLASKIFAACKPCQREVSIRWTDGDVKKKARLDLFCEEAKIEMKRVVKDRITGDTFTHCFQYNGPVIIDLKTAADPCEHEFKRSVWKYGYDRQAAWYVDAAVAAWKVLPIFLFIVVGSSKPHDVYVYEMPTDRIEQAKVTNAGIVKLLTECRESCVYNRVDEMEILTLE